MKKLIPSFKHATRYEMFLVALFWSYFCLSTMGVLLNFISGDVTDLLINLFFLFLTIVLYGIYLLTQNYTFTRGALVATITLSTYVILVANDYQVSYFHIIVPLIFFLLFSLKVSLIIMAVHTTIVVLLYALGYIYTSDITLFPTMNQLIGSGLASLAFVLFGISFHLSIEDSYKKLEKANNKNQFLLKEIHHRVKNNLNIISSLIGLQQLKQKDNPEIQKILRANRLRIDTISMVHESLYKSENLEQIDTFSYLKHLTHKVIAMEESKTIALHVKGKEMYLPFDHALSLGIITNELVTNSIKYAFTTNGTINLYLERDTNEITYIYKDNGSTPISSDTLSNKDTLGIKLIQVMVEEVEGIMEMHYNKGLQCTIRIPYDG
jgi:two-component sensor histidine kinase